MNFDVGVIYYKLFPDRKSRTEINVWHFWNRKSQTETGCESFETETESHKLKPKLKPVCELFETETKSHKPKPVCKIFETETETGNR